jgi:hypothetical protein
MRDHWLVRKSTIRRLWLAFIAVLAITVILDAFVQHESHFRIDGTFAFGAWFGFASCVALILLAKALGSVLKRRDSYYDG